MGLLKEATNSIAAAKFGFYGETGCGKTHTSIEVAMGLAKLTNPKKPLPIAFFDTEGGSDFHVGRVKKEGVSFLVLKNRSFQTLMAFMKEARQIKAVIIIDSITHVWDDLKESYEKKLGRKKGLEIWDWGVIKPTWREFTNEYLSSPSHAIVCGRSTNIYEQVFNEEKGKSEVQQTGQRMRTEKETGYEPSLLVEMERRQRRGEGAIGYDRVASVVKDRTDMMDGAEIINPKFSDFLPHVQALNIGGTHYPTDTKSDSQDLFDRPTHTIKISKKIEIACEKIKDAFLLGGFTMRSDAGKKEVKDLLVQFFGTSSWGELETLKPGVLEEGLSGLNNYMEERKKQQ